MTPLGIGLTNGIAPLNGLAGIDDSFPFAYGPLNAGSKVPVPMFPTQQMVRGNCYLLLYYCISFILPRQNKMSKNIDESEVESVCFGHFILSR